MTTEQKVALIDVTGQDGAYLAEFLLNTGYIARSAMRLRRITATR